MTDVQIEVFPAGSTPITAFRHVPWPAEPGTNAQLRSDLPWSMAPFTEADVAARDFARIAISAFIADLAVAKPAVTLHRDVELCVHVEWPEAWTEQATQAMVDLLHWLTGDTWHLQLTEAMPVSWAAGAPDPPHVGRVQLLSGGLDSLCGAIVA